MRDHRMPALRTIALVVIAAWGTAGYAAGLGPIRVQSALGQSLRASVPVLGADMPELTASCIRVRLEHPDGLPMMPVRAVVARNGEAAIIQLSTRQTVNEPAVSLNLEVACGNHIQRNYQLLLDPIVNLPHLAQAGQTEPAAGEGSRNRLGEQAMVAPAEQAASAPQRRAAARKAREEVKAPAAVRQPEAAAPRKPAGEQQQARKVTRSVLKLSGDDDAIDTGAIFSPALKLSDTLSDSRDTGDAQSAAELKKAYDRFAAVIRGEDLVQSSEKQLQDMQARLQELEAQTARIKEQAEQQRQEDRAALASLDRDTVSARWASALGVLLLAALAAIGWLYYRIKEIGRSQSAELWEKTVLGQHTELGDWEHTVGSEETHAEVPGASAVAAATKPSDWERGIPLDDTLAVDWASRNATLHGASLQMPKARAEEERGGQAADDTAEPGSFEWQEAGQDGGRDAGQAEPVTPPAKPQPAGTPQRLVAGTATGIASAASNAPATSGSRNGAAQLMEVGEISDLMQEAEFWMLLNDAERAIAILEPCLQVAHPVSPLPWIYLLDLYRVCGQQENYESLATRVKKVFNTSVPAWGVENAGAPALSLRDYPHVVAMIEDLWEGNQIVPYLESLLADEREGDRAGFDLAVYREIIHLIGVARDPKAPRRREQLCFDAPQSRLISQKVSMSQPRRPGSAAPISEVEADVEANVFDRATALQSTSRQAAAKSAALKPTAAALPGLDMLEAVEDEAPLAEQSAAASALPEAAAVAVALQAPAPAPDSAVVSDSESVSVDARAGKAMQAAMDPAPMPAVASAPVLAPAEPASAGLASAPAADSRGDAERVADMARKLDLVLAYQEIGENVGARVLLEEVIQGGTPLQVEKARAMLKKLLREIDWQ